MDAILKDHSWVRDKFWKLNALKNDGKCFLFHLKSSFLLKFLSSLFGHMGKRFDKKVMVDFKIYDGTG